MINIPVLRHFIGICLNRLFEIEQPLSDFEQLENIAPAIPLNFNLLNLFRKFSLELPQLLFNGLVFCWYSG